jgi:hypothetical protein
MTGRPIRGVWKPLFPAKVPPQVREVYHAVSEDLYAIRYTITLYSQLYCRAGDPESVEALNRAAGAAFFHIQSCIFRDLPLRVVCLCGPAKQHKYDNCTFYRLVEVVESDGKQVLANRLRRRLERLKSLRVESVRTLRDKRIAHSDYSTKVQQIGGWDIMPGVSMVDVGKTVRSMRRLLRDVAREYDIPPDPRCTHTYDGPRFGNEVYIRGRLRPPD